MTIDPIPGSQTPDRNSPLQMGTARPRFNHGAYRHLRHMRNDGAFLSSYEIRLLFLLQR
jgi:hypothetical protein